MATIVADLMKPDTLPADTFDCAIITPPGGTVLATVPGISQIDRHEMERWGDYWRFTSLSARLLFESAFGAEHVTVEVHGNVLAATALLYGLAREELTDAELQARDPDYLVIIAIRAIHAVGEPAPEADWLRDNATVVSEVRRERAHLMTFRPRIGARFGEH